MISKISTLFRYYLGIEVAQSSRGIFISHRTYVIDHLSHHHHRRRPLSILQSIWYCNIRAGPPCEIENHMETNNKPHAQYAIQIPFYIKDWLFSHIKIFHLDIICAISDDSIFACSKNLMQSIRFYAILNHHLLMRSSNLYASNGGVDYIQPNPTMICTKTKFYNVPDIIHHQILLGKKKKKLHAVQPLKF